MTFFDCSADLVGQLNGNGQKGMLQIGAPPVENFWLCHCLQHNQPTVRSHDDHPLELSAVHTYNARRCAARCCLHISVLVLRLMGGGLEVSHRRGLLLNRNQVI